ncbi:carbon monoxide dehydrogenase subunit G [Aneurinibacillus soli]|uniref:Activator of Hsp90 ATPase homologue 1/2-like C-terminal domain-containing protein n=1 Tax=Aneurinibacillus soli TaxID=1500254 RepID=A0A0U5BDU0_9BACL|nr:SRPBCC domain-containing protein [Aneurinibacillus soli]PYE61735.1 carbon monoxide dehydrogenase subunit G [Aneurinibacillus soli]BAU28407.1 hypothetical protein CB4_02581 [Aneurinibacillus soli]
MDLRYEFYIGGTPEQVWKVLISPEETKKIYAGCVIRSTFKHGDPLQYVGPGLEGNETVHVYGTILEFERNKVFSYTQNTGKAYISNDKNYESRISFRLEPAGACTKLTLIHDQWSEKDPSYENSKKAWWLILCNSKSLVETGKTLDLGVDNWHDELVVQPE